MQENAIKLAAINVNVKYVSSDADDKKESPFFIKL